MFNLPRTIHALDYNGNLYTKQVISKPTNYEELWRSFVAAQSDPELVAWRERVYVPGQYQGIGNRLETRLEFELKEKEG